MPGISSFGTGGFDLLSALRQRALQNAGATTNGAGGTSAINALNPSGASRSAFGAIDSDGDGDGSWSRFAPVQNGSQAVQGGACGSCGNLSPTALMTLIRNQAQPASSVFSSSTLGSTTNPTSDIQSLFSALDTNGDHQISLAELQSVLSPNASSNAQPNGTADSSGANGNGAVKQNEPVPASGHHHHHHHHAESGADIMGALPQGGTVAQGATTQVSTNADGSTTTALNFANGSTITLTTPAALSPTSSPTQTSSNYASSANGASFVTNKTMLLSERLLEALIDLQSGPRLPTQPSSSTSLGT